MYRKVAGFAQSWCGFTLRAIRHDSSAEGRTSQGHGMVDVCDYAVMAALTATMGSFQGCPSRRKTAATVPVHGDARVQVSRPGAYVRETPDVTRVWRNQVSCHGRPSHRHFQGYPCSSVPCDRLQSPGLSCSRIAWLRYVTAVAARHRGPSTTMDVWRDHCTWLVAPGQAVIMTPASRQGTHLGAGVHCGDVVISADLA